MDKNKGIGMMRMGCAMAVAALSAIGQPTAHAASPAPTTLINGGPIKATPGYDASWFLSGDGRIVGYQPFRTFAEPFPLDANLHIRDIAHYWGTEEPDDSYRGLVAATDDGIYVRDDQRTYATYHWQKWRNERAKFLGACGGYVWITPDNAPDQILQSLRGGEWVTLTLGLSGTVISSVLSTNPVSCLERTVVTQVGNKRVVWLLEELPESPESIWKAIGELPAVNLPASLSALPASYFHDAQHSYVFFAGDTDGKLYRAIDDHSGPEQLFPLKWEVVHEFGAGKYPLVLDDDVVTLIDLKTGEATYQVNFNHGFNSVFAPFDWQPVGFPKVGQPSAAMYLPNGDIVKRAYSDFNGTLYAVNQSGALYRESFEPDENDRPKHVLRLLSEKPDHRHITLGRADVQVLFDADQLSWVGARCSGQDTGVYASQDKAITWTRIYTGTPRQLLRSMGVSADGKDILLANSCVGPSLSTDGGQTWRTPSALNWPFRFGAQFLAIGGGENILYAAGQKPTGQAFVLMASYDPGTQDVGPWQDITPAGLGAPTGLFGGFQSVAVSDESAVWQRIAVSQGPKAIRVAAAQVDSNSYWVRRSAGLGNAHVQGVGMRGAFMAATDQGYFYADLENPFGSWFKITEPYAKPPVTFQVSEAGAFLNGSDFAAVLPDSSLRLAPAPECTDVLTNGSMDERTAWQLPLTRVRAAYVAGGGFGDSDGLRLGPAEKQFAPTSYSTAFQDVAVPADAKRIVLRTFMLRRASATPGDDLQYIRVTSLSRRASVRTLLRSTINSNHWEAQEFDLTAYKGQRVRVLFGVYNNGRGGVTSMIVDSISLLACQ